MKSSLASTHRRVRCPRNYTCTAMRRRPRARVCFMKEVRSALAYAFLCAWQIVTLYVSICVDLTSCVIV